MPMGTATRKQTSALLVYCVGKIGGFDPGIHKDDSSYQPASSLFTVVSFVDLASSLLPLGILSPRSISGSAKAPVMTVAFPWVTAAPA